MPNFPPLLSRVHPLKTIDNTFVKREDELSCTISGSKLRKYSSLIPFLVQNKCKRALLCGSFNSNHLLGLSQLLIENNIIPILFALKPNSEIFKGNAALLKCLVNDDQIHWIERRDWIHVKNYMQAFKDKSPLISTYLIPEGAFMRECLKGAFTLSQDIIRNEEELNLKFDHLFVDSGSGMTAISLILGMHFLKMDCHIHIVLMADTFEIFNEKLKKFYCEFQEVFNTEMSLPKNFTLYYPDQAKSFGSVCQKNLILIKEFAQKEGFFLDPIYNIKLFKKAESVIKMKALKGPNLIIHSGGIFSLAGFLDKIVI